MPTGPQGQKRPADVIGAAVLIMRIATGQVFEDKEKKNKSASDAGKIGGKKRAEVLSPTKRKQIARKGAKARWSS
jgi:hypothetical protein